jgi:hypothetical protein
MLNGRAQFCDNPGDQRAALSGIAALNGAVILSVTAGLHDFMISHAAEIARPG